MGTPNHFAFAFHDSYHLCAVSEVSSKDADGLPIAGTCLRLKEKSSSHKQLFKDSKVRRLLNEMHSVYYDARILNNTTGKLDSDSTLAISTKYRSVLRAAGDMSNLNDPYMQDFAFWSLFEIMFLEKGDRALCLDLMKWAQDSFTFPENVYQAAKRELNDGLGPNSGKMFWQAVVSLLVGMRFNDCISMLKIVGDRSSNILIEHLENFQENWILSETNYSKFEKWQQELDSMIVNSVFENRNIEFLAKTLIGDRRALARIREVIVTEWWHIIPFLVFTKHFTISYNDLGELAQSTRESFNEKESSDMDPFFVVMNLGDISVIQSILTNPWLGVHLVDTLFSSKVYKQPLHDIRSALFLEYGSSLVVNTNLWEVGFDYLLECGIEGKYRIENHINNMDIEDDLMAEKLFSFCLEKELEESQTCIINTITYKHLRAGNWGASLNWSLRGTKRKTIDTAVNRIVWNATESEISSLAMLENLNKLLLVTPSLHFLYNYYRFHKALDTGDLRSASDVLISLVVSTDVPNAFHKVLFGHLMHILGDDNVTLDTQILYQLLSFFKRYTLRQHEDEEMEQKSMDNIKRLLLMRLSESIVA